MDYDYVLNLIDDSRIYYDRIQWLDLVVLLIGYFYVLLYYLILYLS